MTDIKSKENWNQMSKDKNAIWALSKRIGIPLPFCHTSMMCGKVRIDVIALDESLGKYIPEYDADKCTYKGKEGYSMFQVFAEKYGEDVVEQIEDML